MKNIKSLLMILTVLMTVTGLYAKEKKEKNQSQTETVISLQEIETGIENANNLDDYFSDTDMSSTTTSNIRTTSTVWIFVRMILVLAIVVVLIYGVLYFIKKKTNIVKDEDDFLRRAAYLNIAPGKTVEVITLVDKAYLIGVTEDNISMLGEITDKELIQAMNLNADKKQNTKKPMNFDDVLQLFMGGKNRNNIFNETERKINNIFDNK